MVVSVVIMANCGHQCYKCGHFNKYYTNDGVRFQKTKFGYCRANRTNVSVHENCEKYAFMQHSKRRYDSLINARLNNLLTEISVLRELIEEDERDNNL